MATLLFFAAAEGLDLSVVDRWPGGSKSSPLSYAWVSLLYPALGIWFWLLNRRGFNSEPDSGGDH